MPLKSPLYGVYIYIYSIRIKMNIGWVIYTEFTQSVNTIGPYLASVL